MLRAFFFLKFIADTLEPDVRLFNVSQLYRAKARVMREPVLVQTVQV